MERIPKFFTVSKDFFLVKGEWDLGVVAIFKLYLISLKNALYKDKIIRNYLNFKAKM